MDCLFCKIVRGEIQVPRLAEDEFGLAFPDINPGAPVHVLVVPKEHVATLPDAAARPELIASDGYHPSDLGYARWAELMWDAVRSRIRS